MTGNKSFAVKIMMKWDCMKVYRDSYFINIVRIFFSYFVLSMFGLKFSDILGHWIYVLNNFVFLIKLNENRKDERLIQGYWIKKLINEHYMTLIDNVHVHLH